jgi:hypothetical protein
MRRGVDRPHLNQFRAGVPMAFARITVARTVLKEIDVALPVSGIVLMRKNLAIMARRQVLHPLQTG